MANSHNAWDGKQLTGTMSGFSAYTTTDSETGKKVESITPFDLLRMIKEIKSFLSLPELESINKILYAHATAKGNPHNTQLTDYPDDVADALFEEFKKQGGTCTKEEYIKALFQLLHIASNTEMIEGTDPNALLSIAGVRNAIHDHEMDPEAHRDLLDRMLPGEPVVTAPILSINSNIGVPTSMVKEDTKGTDQFSDFATYSYVGIDGMLRLAPAGTLPVDFQYGVPLIPMFGHRTNEIRHHNNFDQVTFEHCEIDVKTGLAPTGELEAKVLTGIDGTPGIVKFTLADVALKKNISKTVSVFVKAGYCNRFMISFTDLLTQTPVRALFNLENGEHVVLNHATRYDADIAKLADGWYRCALTLFSNLDMMNDVEFVFFKEKEADQEDFITDCRAGETFGYIFGLQLEDGPSMSPLIFTNGVSRTRKSLYLETSVPNITKALTVNVTFKNNQLAPGLTDRPILTMYDRGIDPACQVVFRSNRMVEVMRWASVDLGKETHETVISQQVFEAQTQMYCKLTTGIGPKMIRTGINDTIRSEKTPEAYNVGTKLIVGTDRTGKHYEGYVRDVTIYPSVVSEAQVKFLNGAELYEHQ